MVDGPEPAKLRWSGMVSMTVIRRQVSTSAQRYTHLERASRNGTSSEPKSSSSAPLVSRLLSIPAAPTVGVSSVCA